MIIWSPSTDFVWGDLSIPEEAARLASKHPYKRVEGDPSGEPVNFLPEVGVGFNHPRSGPHLVLVRDIPPTKAPGVPYLVTKQYGARNLATGEESWAPPGSEGPTRPDVTVNSVRDLCGILDLERKVAALEAQVRGQQARISELESQHVRARRT